MQGKTITFKTEVMSPVHGSFLAGDVAKNVDAQWASDLIAAGVASEGDHGDAAADKAGRLTDKTASEPMRVDRHKFSPADDKSMRQAGVISAPPNVNVASGDGGSVESRTRPARSVEQMNADRQASTEPTDVARRSADQMHAERVAAVAAAPVAHAAPATKVPAKTTAKAPAKTARKASKK